MIENKEKINSFLNRSIFDKITPDLGLRESNFYGNTVFKRCGFLSYNRQKEYILKNGLKIKNNRKFIKSKIEKNKVISFDTETYKGKCLLLCLSENDKEKSDYIYRNDYNSDVDYFEACLNFLMYKSSKKGYYRFFYNIDFDISSILKLWNEKEAISLLSKGVKIKYKEYTLTWLKSRLFIIKKGKKTVYFTDLFNFFKIGLNNASGIYLKDDGKDDIDGNRLNNDLNYWNDNLNFIIKYCIKDCYLTSRLGIELIKGIKECNIQLPRFLVSSASLSKADFRYNCKIPNIEYIPLKIMQIAYDCYFGGRFEMIKSGYFEQLFLYDINSQYPTFIKRMPNLKYGAWKIYNNLTELPKIETFGYFYCKVKIPENNLLSTIPIKYKDVIRFPNGYFEKWFTWYDLDLMRDYISEIKIAYVWIRNKNSKKIKYQYKPFKKRINELYRLKKKYKGVNDMMYLLVKLTMNALYGCFIEQHDNLDYYGNNIKTSGILFNPVYASQITAYGRWSVLKDVPKNLWNHIIAIHTDSIITDIPFNFLKQSDKLGYWNLEAKGKGIIINTGMYQIGYIIKRRGITKSLIKNWLRFCLKYSFENKKTFEIEKMRKIGKALVQDKELTKVNTMVKEIKSVQLNTDNKRTWNSNFFNFDDVLSRNISSLPLMCICYNSKDIDIFPNPLISC